MSQNQMRLDEVRKILLSLLLSRKGATCVTVLDRDYYDVENKRIPYRQFGFTNLVEFLQSMPEYFTIEYHNGSHYIRGTSEKSKHVSSLVARQKSKYPPANLHQTHRRVPHMRSQPVKLEPKKLFCVMKYIQRNPNGVSLQNAAMYVKQKIDPSINFTPYDLWTQLGELSHQVRLSGGMIYPADSSNSVAQQPEERQSSDKSLSDSGLPPIKQNICAAGEENFDCAEYLSDDNDFVPAKYARNQNHAETSELATNHVQYTNCKQTDMFNYNKTNDLENRAMMNSQNNTEMKIADCSDISQLVNDRTKNRLTELMRKHPEGIWCADLPSKYLQEYKVRLNYSHLGFVSVREFTSYLPNIFYMTQANKTDDFKLYSADKKPVVPKTDSVDIKQTSHNRHDEHKIMQARYNDDDNIAPIPSNVSPTITKNFAPNDVMNYNDSVGKISVTNLNTKSFLGVYIVEVFNPSFFWIHLRENKKIFYQMMEELHDFYECNKNTYNIAKIALKKDMNCACIFMTKWHRAIIKSVKPDFRVTVLFYDYGTLKTYAPEDIYYLHKKFSILPAQAIPCGLYNVKPIVGENRWKKSVTDQFIDKIADTLLCATIITIDPTHNSMMVILTDTSEEDDLHINEWLVSERLAQFGITADAVDMASIMKYVVNNLNQLPTYCFAEENLMPDSCCKTTSTGEKYEIPLVSPGPTHYDNHQPVRPPPGFPPLNEQYVPSSFSTTNFHNGYAFANAPNVKVPSFNDVETNPFLADQQLIPNDIAKQMYVSMWNENKKLQISVINVLYDLLENPSLAFKSQIRLNKILKIIEKVLLEQNNHSTAAKTPSASNSTSEPTLNDGGSSTLYNISNETFMKQDINANTFSMSNPFGMNSDDKPQTNAAFTCDSDGFAFKTNWNQAEVNPLTPIPPLSPASSTFTNRISSANTFFPNTNQDGENVPVTPVSPAVATNASIFNNFSEFLDNVNVQFASMLKDTNPFKFPTDKKQIPEMQNERTSHNYDPGNASHFSAKNPQNHSKMETASIHAMNNCFTPARHVSENYTPRIVYESGPVMYNTQKKQADTDSRQNICNNLNKLQNGQSFELGQDKKPTSQLANDASYMQHKVINQVARDNSQVDEKYVTRASTYYTQVSQPRINDESSYYQQNGNVNNLSSQSWNQIGISEHWMKSKFSNIPLVNHNEKAAFSNLTRQDWNCDNGRKRLPAFMSQAMNEATNSNHIFKFNDHDKDKPMNVQTNSWNNIETKSVQPMEPSFLFQKIDSVKGVTFIFNVEQDGWILTCEFVETFTNFKFQSCLLTMLEAMNIPIVFKEIQRSEYPLQFLQLDRYPLNVPRDSEKRILSINLISLQSALALLHKLKIVSREEIENAFKKNEFLDGSVLSTLWILIVTYRDLIRRIELCSNYV